MLLGITLAVLTTATIILLFLSFSREKPAARGGGGMPQRERELVHHYELKGIKTGVRGEPRTCPVCAAVFEHGERVKSKVFPQTQKDGRLLHILGCPYCINGERQRACPVCGAELSPEEYLTARIFPRIEKSHVHVLGCNHCRR